MIMTKTNPLIDLDDGSLEKALRLKTARVKSILTGQIDSVHLPSSVSIIHTVTGRAVRFIERHQYRFININQITALRR